MLIEKFSGCKILLEWIFLSVAARSLSVVELCLDTLFWSNVMGYFIDP